jgi:hypothetical protein
VTAGVLLIGVPLAFNGLFAALAKRFEYPDVLRHPTAEVLARYRAGGTSLQLIWWAFALTAVAMIPLVVLLSHELSDADPEVVDVVFQAFNRFLGVAVGEHLGYLLTGAWTTLIGIALTSESWVGYAGVVIGPVLMLCSLEFVGRRSAWKLAEALTPVAYVAWSLWLIATGVVIL